VITQSMLSNSKAFVPVWLVAFGAFAVFQLPMTLATALLLFVVCVVPPLIMLVLSNGPSLTVAEVLHHAEASRTDR
jgi:hypothetical protein